MPEHKLTGGYSRSRDRYYDLFVSVEADGRVSFREDYDYPERGEFEAREYSYRLWIAAEHTSALLARLAREAQAEPALAPAEAEASLVSLLKQLLDLGKLAPTETARAKENFNTLKAWLEQEQIPYEESFWVW